MLFKQTELWMPHQGKCTKVSMLTWFYFCYERLVLCFVCKALA